MTSCCNQLTFKNIVIIHPVYPPAVDAVLPLYSQNHRLGKPRDDSGEQMVRLGGLCINKQTILRTALKGC